MSHKDVLDLITFRTCDSKDLVELKCKSYCCKLSSTVSDGRSILNTFYKIQNQRF